MSTVGTRLRLKLLHVAGVHGGPDCLELEDVTRLEPVEEVRDGLAVGRAKLESQDVVVGRTRSCVRSAGFVPSWHPRQRKPPMRRREPRVVSCITNATTVSTSPSAPPVIYNLRGWLSISVGGPQGGG